MDGKHKYSFIAIVIISQTFTAVQVFGLDCYACFETGGNNKCEEYETYAEAMENYPFNGTKKNVTRPLLLKKCIEPYNVACVTETYSVLGATVSHIRDCSNGQNFSFDASLVRIRGAYDRLYNLGFDKSNETSCVWDGNHQVCLSICVGDLCNGPLISDFTSGVDFNKASSMGLMILCVLSFIWRSLE